MSTVVDEEVAVAETFTEKSDRYRRQLLLLLTPVRAAAAMIEDRHDWRFFLSETRKLLLFFKESPLPRVPAFRAWKELKVFAWTHQLSEPNRGKAKFSKLGDRWIMRKRLAALDVLMRKAIAGEFTAALCFRDSDWVSIYHGATSDNQTLPPTPVCSDTSFPQVSPDHPRT